MRNRVLIRLRDGKELYAAGYASDVSQTINTARGSGQLIQVERDVIPTGQMFHLDPDEVVLVRDDG
jgi:hypothetical protein